MSKISTDPFRTDPFPIPMGAWVLNSSQYYAPCLIFKRTFEKVRFLKVLFTLALVWVTMEFENILENLAFLFGQIQEEADVGGHEELNPDSKDAERNDELLKRAASLVPNSAPGLKRSLVQQAFAQAAEAAHEAFP